LIVQLAGNDPSMIVDAARIVLDHANSDNNNKIKEDEVVTGFDLNLGCPQSIARKGKYGAFLFEEDEDLVYRILQQLRLSLPSSIKVSAKIRLPLNDDDNDTHQILRERITKLINIGGIDFLTVHGRTLKENKAYAGGCHYDSIRKAVEIAQSIQPDFPVIANGGIETYNCLDRVLQQTSASAIMSSEALLETPDLFSPSFSSIEKQQQPFQFAKDYIQLCSIHPPLPGSFGRRNGSMTVVRNHLFYFLHQYIQDHPDLRLRLLRAVTLQDTVQLVRDLEQRINSDTINNNNKQQQSQEEWSSSSWYRRHWNSTNNNDDNDTVRGLKNRHHSQNVYQGKREGSSSPVISMTLEEKKQKIKDRIQKLQKQKLKNKGVEEKSLLEL